jgi:DNA-binding transcriptional MocR family regulator
VALRALAAGQTVYVPHTVLPEHQTALEFAGAHVTLFDPLGDLPVSNGGLLVLPALDPSTGQRFSVETLQRLALWAAESDLTVVADEIDLLLLRGEAGGQPFAAQPGMAERTLTLGGFAETPGLAAWKVAWFAGPPALVAQARTLKQAMTICTPAASQYAALGALEEDVI